MYAAFLALLADARHRLTCAMTTDPAHRTTSAAQANARLVPWMDAGLPFRRTLWAAAWLTHWTLYPVRVARRTQGR